MKPSRLIAILGVCIFGMNSAKVVASDLVTYQGKLTNAASEALPDGQYRIGFRIWDVASGGTQPLWARKYDVPVQGGLFSVMIGSEGVSWEDGDPLTKSLKLALSGTNRFVEITVMSDAGQPEKPVGEWKIMAPRQALNAVPFAMNGVPAGTVVPFAGTTVPDGWLPCDGSSYSTADRRFAGLFAAIQTVYGSGPGVFRVPDLRGRSAIGAGQGEGLTSRPLAAKLGAESETLSPSHLPAHSHSGTTEQGNAMFYRVTFIPGGGAAPNHVTGYAANSTNHDRTDGNWPMAAHTHNFTTNGGNGLNANPAAFNVIQPSIVLNYIIKL